jgi:hypothetical protein
MPQLGSNQNFIPFAPATVRNNLFDFTNGPSFSTTYVSRSLRDFPVKPMFSPSPCLFAA